MRRSLLLAAIVLCAAAPRHHAHRVNAPSAIGHFDDWKAATHVEGGQTVCYAYTRAATSMPVLRGRGDVVLMVTQRPSTRDAVALSAGFAYPRAASVPLRLGPGTFDLYTAQRSAFAKDGHAVILALAHETRAVAISPSPRGGDVIDTFSLKGFDAAYQAASKACPAT